MTKRILIVDKGKFEPTYTRCIQRLGLNIKTDYAPNSEIARSKINTETLDLALVDQDMESSSLVVLAAESREIPTAILYYPISDQERFKARKILAYLDKSNFKEIADFVSNFFSQQKTN